MNLYFISDAHLGFNETDVEKEKRGRLYDFLDHLETKGEDTELYLLGDIFDFWFQWYHVIPRYWFPVLHRLRKLVDAGIKVYFITGNHDFYPGTFLEEEVGIECFHESHQFERNGKRFFVAHGDGLAKKDRGYRLLKKIIRNPVSIFLYKTFIPADLGMQFAKWTSQSSRSLVKIEKHSWSEEYYQYARGKFEEGFDYVVMGHIHFPLHREEEGTGKTYVNNGDWMTQFTYAHYNGNKLSLEYWPDKDE